jgi:tetratricopeptide (TPR) repeat protein
MSSIIKWAAIAAGVVSLSGFAASGARAAVTVFGDDHAQACYQAAKNGLGGPSYLDECNQAINFGLLRDRDLAGTYVNRGAVYMTMQAWPEAEADFNHALSLQPNLGEALVNLGAAQIGLHRNQEGVDTISRGLALGSMEPEKAYFNRAIGYEALGDDKHAYYDYLKASQLAPKWVQPREELVRFTVHPQ